MTYVCAQHPEYSNMRVGWDLANALWGGTPNMRCAGALYLPQQPKEHRETWEYRLKSSTLYGAWKKSVKELASKPFQRKVVYSTELSAPLGDDFKNVDGRGLDLTAFSSKLFQNAVKYGKIHFICDMPQVPEGVVQTLADQRLPYWQQVLPENVTYWEEGLINGVRGLTEIRYIECVMTPKSTTEGSKALTKSEYEVTWTTTSWRRVVASGEYAGQEVNSGEHDLGEIPFVTINLDEPGEMCADPVLEDLMWMNVAHWQSFSDQRNAIRVARAAFLFAKGFTKDQLDGVGIGPTAIVTHEDTESDMKMIEVSGAALGAGRQEVIDLVEMMNTLGQAPMMKVTSNSTAYGVATNEQRGHAEILDWIHELSRGLRKGCELKCKWMKTALPEDFEVIVFRDFPLLDPSSISLNALHEVRRAGDIDRRTYLVQLTARGVFTGDFNVDQVMAATELEGKRDAALIESALTGRNDPSGDSSGDVQDSGDAANNDVHANEVGTGAGETDS